MKGDHVYVRRRTYSHHGIDCGDGTVIHYIGERRATRWIERTSWEEFARTDRVLVRTYRSRLLADEIVRNAESRLGDGGYHLVRNNCEHFATWSSTGSSTSSQVRRWAIAAPGAVASVGTVDVAGLHVVLLGSLGMGVYVLARPRRRARQAAGAAV
jgi:Lecithin retinol acyltransferase